MLLTEHNFKNYVETFPLEMTEFDKESKKSLKVAIFP